MDASEIITSEIIEEITRRSFKVIKKVYDFQREAKPENKKNLTEIGSRILFPKYSEHRKTSEKEKDRISEQELRFIFVEQLNKYAYEKNIDLYYSVETPTKFYYRSARNGNEPGLNGTRSGKIDLTLYDKNENPIAFFEFKSGSLASKIRELKYDILKLIMEASYNNNCLGYSLHLVKASTNKVTNFDDHIKEAIKIIEETPKDSKEYNEINKIKENLNIENLKTHIFYKPIAIC